VEKLDGFDELSGYLDLVMTSSQFAFDCTSFLPCLGHRRDALGYPAVMLLLQNWVFS
jgi:hypothetical protein